MIRVLIVFLCSLSKIALSTSIMDVNLERSMGSLVPKTNAPDIQKSHLYAKPPIEKATSIEPFYNDFQASHDLLCQLFSYEPIHAMRYLESLNFSGCKELDDAHIKMMCDNRFFYRLKMIDLSNTRVTKNAIQYIFDSNIGSIRGLPEISKRFFKQSTTLTVIFSCKDTTEEIVREYRKSDFPIFYETYNGESSIFDSCEDGVKILTLIVRPEG